MWLLNMKYLRLLISVFFTCFYIAQYNFLLRPVKFYTASCSRPVGDSWLWGSLSIVRLEIRLNAFRRSNILQKQFITIIFIIIIKDFVSIQSHPHYWCYHYLIIRVFCRVFLLKVRLCKRKNKLCMDFAPTKFPVNVLSSIFASNISLIIVCNVWIKCR